jgi:hypothetical protein
VVIQRADHHELRHLFNVNINININVNINVNFKINGVRRRVAWS